jgi:hypothetical protein
MRRIELTVTTTDDSGAVRQEQRTVEPSAVPAPEWGHRIVHMLFTELAATVSERDEPKHNAIANRWIKFPNRPAGFDQYFDIRNSQALWIELANLVMGAEADLISARAFKALEPPQEPPFDDDVAVNDLYIIHDRKITFLNQSVHDLIKVQDLVNRLLHESLGGDLVDAIGPDWERVELTRANVMRGLNLKLTSGVLPQKEFDAITQSLAIPKDTPKGEIARAYRNRLMHHVRPSIDYSMFFSPLESRVGEEVKDASGKVVGRRHAIYAKAPVEYLFQDLQAACSEYLDAIVRMLQSLSVIDILRR